MANRFHSDYEDSARDSEPQPGEGPEYHAEHQSWLERQKPQLQYYDGKLVGVDTGWVYPTPKSDAVSVTTNRTTPLCKWCDKQENTEHSSDCPMHSKHVAEGKIQFMPPLKNDMVNHPSHYTGPVPGIEAIDVIRHFNLLRGNAIKYLWRADYKGSKRQDLEKALWYIKKELEHLDD